MSVKYRLVKRMNLGKDQEENPEKLYAQAVYSDLVGFEELLGEISEAGIPSNQVKGVADRMNHLFKKHLAAGRRVQFGEFGNFRYGVGSTGAVTEEGYLYNREVYIKNFSVNLFLHKNFNTFVENHIYLVNYYLL